MKNVLPSGSGMKLNIPIPATINISNLLLYYVAVVEYIHLQKLRIPAIVKAQPNWKEVQPLLTHIEKFYLKSDTFAIFDRVIGFDQDAKIRIERTLDDWMRIFLKSSNEISHQMTSFIEEYFSSVNKQALSREEVKLFNSWYDYNFSPDSSTHRQACQAKAAGNQAAFVAHILYMHHPAHHTVVMAKGSLSKPNYTTHTHKWVATPHQPFTYECSLCPEVTTIGAQVESMWS